MTNPNTAELWDQRYGVDQFSSSPPGVFARLRGTHGALYDVVTDHMKPKAEGELEILDVGSGPGVLPWLYFTRFAGVKHVGRYDMVDHSEVAIEGARFHFGHIGFFGFHCIDLEVHDWPTRKYNLIVCVETLEHLTLDESAVRRMRDKIRSGGRILISVPLGSAHKLHLRGYDEAIIRDRIVAHLHPFNRFQPIHVFPTASAKAPKWTVVVVDF